MSRKLVIIGRSDAGINASLEAPSLIHHIASLIGIVARQARKLCVLLVRVASIKEEQVHEKGEEMDTITEHAWETFHAPLKQFIRRCVSDNATAEDLLQDVFLNIHQHVDTLRDVKKLESWIYQVTRNTIIDYYRSTRATTTLDVPEALQLAEDLPDEDVISELFPCVRSMVTSLPTQDRQALILTEYQGLTQKELAERLGLSFSGAKSRVQRARAKLKQLLLACCHFELDRRGHIINYQSRCACCTTEACCAEESVIHIGSTRLRPS